MIIRNKNELPTKLIIKIMQYSSNEGDLVCDFFLGGFNTAKVAIGLKRKVIGFDINKSRISELEKGIDRTLEVESEDLLAAKHLTFSSEVAKIEGGL